RAPPPAARGPGRARRAAAVVRAAERPHPGLRRRAPRRARARALRDPGRGRGPDRGEPGGVAAAARGLGAGAGARAGPAQGALVVTLPRPAEPLTSPKNPRV